MSVGKPPGEGGPEDLGGPPETFQSLDQTARPLDQTARPLDQTAQPLEKTAAQPLDQTVQPLDQTTQSHDRPTATPPPEAVPPELGSGLTPDSFIGRFFLLKPLGAGGMGVVWAAYDPQLDRKVALKFVRSDPSESPESDTLHRLMREAQAMAKVNHPNVIAIHDVGTARGQLYLAEELVNGTDLSEWLKARAHSGEEILGVFLQAGRGLAAAHAAGVVHRDFKPANVIVAEDGQVKVVDFGLARNLAQAANESTPSELARTLPISAPPVDLHEDLTQTGDLLGTPLYMSPEQHRGQTADARSDQFSYCVSLYQALYGELPFSGDTLRELSNSVLSGKVRSAPKGAKVPSWLREVLLRGLHREPSARFPDMEALLRALSADPLAARRRRAGAAVIAAGLLATAGAVYHQVESRLGMCQGAGDKLTGVWDEGRQQATRNAFLGTGLPFAQRAWESVEHELGTYAGDWVALHTEVCEATRLRGEQSEEVLDLRMACLSQRLQELKASSELFVHADKSVVEKALEIANGLSPLAACSDLEELKAPLRRPKDAVTRSRIEQVRGRIAGAKVLETAGKYAEGIGEAEAVVEEAKTIDYEPLQAEALEQLGSLQMLARKDELATQSLEDAFFRAESSRDDEVAARSSTLLVTQLGVDQIRHAEGHLWAHMAQAVLQRGERAPLSQARLARRVGRLLWDEGKFDEALAELHRAQVISMKEPRPDPLEIASIHFDLGTVLNEKGKYEEALEEHRQALTFREKALGPDHPDVATSHNAIGNVLDGQGKYDEALGEYRQALGIRERSLGPEHPDVATSHNNIGVVLNNEGEYEEAIGQYRQALRIRERALGPDHPSLASSHNNVGAALYSLGDYEEAIGEYRQALSTQEKTLGANHPDVALSHNNIGGALMGEGKYEEALGELRRALTVREKVLGADHPDVASSHEDIGTSLYNLGEYEEALGEYRQSLSIREKALGPDHSDVALSHHEIGTALYGEGKFEEALGEQGKALAIDEKALSPEHPDTANVLVGMGKALLGLHRLDQSLDHLHRAVTIFEAHPSRPQDLAEARFTLARALWDSNQDRLQAVKLARQAREPYSKYPGLRKNLQEIDAWLKGHDSKG